MTNFLNNVSIKCHFCSRMKTTSFNCVGHCILHFAFCILHLQSCPATKELGKFWKESSVWVPNLPGMYIHLADRFSCAPAVRYKMVVAILRKWNLSRQATCSRFLLSVLVWKNNSIYILCCAAVHCNNGAPPWEVEISPQMRELSRNRIKVFFKEIKLYNIAENNLPWTVGRFLFWWKMEFQLLHLFKLCSELRSNSDDFKPMTFPLWCIEV